MVWRQYTQRGPIPSRTTFNGALQARGGMGPGCTDVGPTLFSEVGIFLTGENWCSADVFSKKTRFVASARLLRVAIV